MRTEQARLESGSKHSVEFSKRVQYDSEFVARKSIESIAVCGVKKSDIKSTKQYLPTDSGENNLKNENGCASPRLCLGRTGRSLRAATLGLFACVCLRS
jgi:hypothetical protein